MIFAKSFAPGSPGGRWGTNDSMGVKVFKLKKTRKKSCGTNDQVPLDGTVAQVTGRAQLSACV